MKCFRGRHKRAACGYGVCLLAAVNCANLAIADDERDFKAAIIYFNTGKSRKELLDDAPKREYFARAAERLNRLTLRGVRNPSHYRNQGIAEHMSGQLGKAILSYRRGLRLAPDHEKLRYNLEYARSLVVKPRAADLVRPPVDVALPAFGLNAALLAAFVFWSLAFAAATVWLITARSAWPAAALLSLLIALCCGAYAGWRTWERHVDEVTPLVVIAKNKTPFYQGNGVSYPLHADVPELSEGLEARRVHQRGDWLQIQFASGVTGWVRADAAFVNTPPQKGPN